MSILLYGCTTWMLTKRIEKKLDSNCTRMLQAILNKSWNQHPTKKQLQGHLRLRHAGHCWRSKDELISDVLQWTPSLGRASGGWSARTYLQQLCTDIGCSLEDLPEVMDDKEGWWEKFREIRANSMTWWWWYFVWPYKLIFFIKRLTFMFFSIIFACTANVSANIRFFSPDFQKKDTVIEITQ